MEKLLKNKIDPITVVIKINSKANILKGSKIKDKELFSSSFEAFSYDLKINRSKEEFNKEVVNNQYGKPFLKLHGNAKAIFKKMNKNSKLQIEISLSDEKKYAIANVIIYD